MSPQPSTPNYPDPHPDLAIPADLRGGFKGNNDFRVVGSIDNGNAYDVTPGQTVPMVRTNCADD